MKIEQIYTGCLSQGAYFIESEGEAAVIDPLREVQPYLDKAKREDATIKYVFETHFHADFVSGHLDLSKKTGAPIVYGPNANPNFAAHIAADGEAFRLGKITIKALHTPGHTMESTCYLLLDEKREGNCAVQRRHLVYRRRGATRFGPEKRVDFRGAGGVLVRQPAGENHAAAQ